MQSKTTGSPDPSGGPPGRRPPRRRLGWGLLANLLLSATASALTLGALEVASRLWERRAANPSESEYIARWDKLWQGDFYTVGSGGLGWPPHTEFNPDGVRDRVHATQTPEGTRRVALLGDSVTLGQGLEPHETWPHLLQEGLDSEGRPVEVLSFALWGWSTRQHRHAYARLARKYRPERVVVVVCLNDVPEMQNNLVRPPRLVSWLHQRSALVRLVVDAKGREIASTRELFERRNASTVRDGFERFYAELELLGSEVAADGASLAVAVFPFRFQLEPGAPEPSVQREILTFCSQRGWPALDLLDALAPAGPAAFLDDNHPSPEGARLAAEAILRSALLPAAAPSRNELLALRLGSGAEDLEALRAALRAPDQDLRAAAAWGLGRRPVPEAVDAVMDLAEALADPTERVRLQAALSLGRLGAAAAPAARALLMALRDPCQGVRFEAARAVYGLGVGPDAVPALRETLRNSPDSYLRSFALYTLGGLGRAAVPAIPDIAAALDGPEAWGLGGAAMALARLGPLAAPAVPDLARHLRAGQGPVWYAARALGRIGPAAREAVPELLEAAGSSDELLRVHALRALGRVAPADPRVYAALEAALRDGPEEMRREAEAVVTGRRRLR